jgi:preprotein translocase subunit SecG
MYIFLLIIHVIISVLLVLVILAQSSKGGALDGLVGGAASDMFGSHGASKFLDKWTKIIGAIWVVSSLVLAINVRSFSSPTGSKAIKKIRSQGTTEMPLGNDGVSGETVIPAETATPVEATE